MIQESTTWKKIRMRTKIANVIPKISSLGPCRPVLGCGIQWVTIGPESNKH